MKEVINHLKVPVEAGESQEQALKRAQLQLKISDEQLVNYKITYIKIPEIKLNYRKMGVIRWKY